ncbi:Demethylmenaquinone methyltransferase [Chlamydiales bacterium STE3]|nr:Demethylmenaquinone methyltransferase [Chlamydiales bacterium STE3]
MKNATRLSPAIYAQDNKTRKMTSYNKQDSASIQSMFASIAAEYDRANAILSFNMHKLWNKKLVHLTNRDNDFKDSALLDLCAGTGEITKTWMLRNKETKKAYLLDFCPEMLALAKHKMDVHFRSQDSFNYLHADAEKIPLEDSSVEAITIAYGIRNVHCIENCFQEAFRVLKPGGKLGILELTSPEITGLKQFHHFYLKRLLPILGGFVAKNKDAYKYLCQSIESFVKPQEIKSKLLTTGYSQVDIHPQCLGIATVIIAKKN